MNEDIYENARRVIELANSRPRNFGCGCKTNPTGGIPGPTGPTGV